MEVISSEEVRGKPVMIVLNKTDLISDRREGLESFASAVCLNQIIEERAIDEIRQIGSISQSTSNDQKRRSYSHTAKIEGSALDVGLAHEIKKWLGLVFRDRGASI